MVEWYKIRRVGNVSVRVRCTRGRVARLSVYEVIKNCPRYSEVALNGPKLKVSSASLLGAQ